MFQARELQLGMQFQQTLLSEREFDFDPQRHEKRCQTQGNRRAKLPLLPHNLSAAREPEVVGYGVMVGYARCADRYCLGRGMNES